MHLILLLHFNTTLAVYPADEIELITLPSEYRLGASATGRGGGPAAAGGKAQPSLSRQALLSPAHRGSQPFFSDAPHPAERKFGSDSARDAQRTPGTEP